MVKFVNWPYSCITMGLLAELGYKHIQLEVNDKFASLVDQGERGFGPLYAPKNVELLVSSLNFRSKP